MLAVPSLFWFVWTGTVAIAISYLWASARHHKQQTPSSPMPSRITTIAAPGPDSLGSNSNGAAIAGEKCSGSTKFYGSQVGGKSVINYSYTDLPFRLLGYDVYYFFRFAWAIPYVVLPASPPYISGDMDELSPTRENLFCIVVHAVLIVMQLGFVLVLLPVMVLLPVWTAAMFIAAFLVCNRLICKVLNGDQPTLTSNPEYAPALEKHAHEQWIFVNGVAVGKHWLQNNLDRLALTFKRPILGIHNKTDGIIFDIVECLVQRTFGYATDDVRLCYAAVKEKLYDPQYSKVVLILHSQGGIEGGMVLDWLLQEMPQDLLAKVEVYTFGNAANHFNNPHLHVTSQENAEANPLAASMDVAEPTEALERSASSDNAVAAASKSKKKKNGGRRTHGNGGSSSSSSINSDALESMLTRETSAPRPSAISDRVIGHVEHYAHTTDFVALWGVLHFATSTPATLFVPRFIGRLFARTSVRGGHQLCMHYLDGMFPLRRDESAPGGFSGCIEAGPAEEGLNDFMDSEVVVGGGGGANAVVDVAGAAFKSSWVGVLKNEMEGLPAAAAQAADEVEVMNAGQGLGKGAARTFKVKQLSRLWQYRDGRSPEDNVVDGPLRGKTL
ncbi:hypothetical protein MGG_00837 [Pyricularia oryzae 70-15]|uniref:Uncharacterized protein n=1 Tax=Pyricularia oryzae (strain 70-15 / ATCC MYA-4617 / FGSC 8958) TaxID=242507 RepID=G4NE25_PYRO7|nr:uncharacterized protein MGG_00837 [Pyricularia oryzae 70-15]EHA48560.1 hypothetical protein MGG_00837 [Pyricularia oryzae 70-15]KAI7920772.1 hypothetical protein M0657_006465 [Pyricularia oryzae]